MDGSTPIAGRVEGRGAPPEGRIGAASVCSPPADVRALA